MLQIPALSWQRTAQNRRTPHRPKPDHGLNRLCGFLARFDLRALQNISHVLETGIQGIDRTALSKESRTLLERLETRLLPSGKAFKPQRYLNKEALIQRFTRNDHWLPAPEEEMPKIREALSRLSLGELQLLELFGYEVRGKNTAMHEHGGMIANALGQLVENERRIYVYASSCGPVSGAEPNYDIEGTLLHECGHALDNTWHHLHRMKPLLERTHKNSKCYRQAAEKIVRDMLDVSNRQYLDCMLSSSHPRLNALTSAEQRQYKAAFVPYYIAGDLRGTPVERTDRIVQGEIFAETRRLRDTPYPRAVGSLIVPGQCPKTQAVLNRMVTALDRAGNWSRIVETPPASPATQKKIDRLEALMQRLVQRIQKDQPGLRSRLTRLYEAQSRLLYAEG